MAAKIGAHPMFERLTEEECAADPVVPLLFTGTEEGQKVERNEGNTFLNVFRRIDGPK
jgi:tRNA (guanine-N7-)-methyltransferase|tara:strand:- start:934 stop:1107 length:174 start_codon:yes stop_codon:yes gene_type:complete